MRIDAVWFNEAPPGSWELGSSYAIAYSPDVVVNVIPGIVEDTTAEWVLFWDSKLGNPDLTLIKELSGTPVDVWHGGLKLGLGGLPRLLDYIDPAWLYNKDAPVNIISSSFRLSLQACLIRTNVLKRLLDSLAGFQSMEMMGLALGYSLIKNGGIIRYHPDLIPSVKPTVVHLPKVDEWVFLRKFFPLKWQLWVMCNMPGLFSNYKYWRSTKSVAYLPCKPSIHSSIEETLHEVEGSVSVLAPTLDRYPYLKRELEQLSVQKHLPIEVLITDQTDAGRRHEIDTASYPGINIRYFPQNEKGQCIAWNKMLGEAKGEYVLFLGDDADNIQPWFIQKLLSTMQRFDADMVASNVIELKMPIKPVNPYFYMSDTFPITLIKTEVVRRAGNMDMFFNKNIRADYDLALRCHESGALMIFDSSALIDHHRAPSGGLRAHKARVVTNAISRQSISKFAEPAVSEIFLVKKHFNALQYKMFIRIKFYNQLSIKGNSLRKIARILMFGAKLPGIIRRYKANVQLAEQEFNRRASS